MFIDDIISLFYPRVCGLCKKKINKNNTCEKCSNILQYTLKKELRVRNIDVYVDKAISLFLYEGFIRNKILEFKFDGKTYISCTFADIMCNIIIKNKICVDIIIPVPIHKKRFKERGYNQSELLSKYIAKKLNIKHESKLLIKKHNNLAQSTLNAENRKKNVIDVYEVRKENRIKGKKILLIDDIYTTGATVNECAKILKQNGAKEVVVLTIAYSNWTREGRK